MVEGGIKDYQLAKRKAVARFRRLPRGQLPGNAEIEAAIEEHQRLFKAGQPHRLLALRQVALQVMNLVASFSPRLVGTVLRGTTDDYSDVVLHVVSEPVESVGTFLDDRSIRYRIGERRLRIGFEKYRRFPMYQFTQEGILIELVVFDRNGARQPPLCPIDGRPMARAALAEVEAMTIER